MALGWAIIGPGRFAGEHIAPALQKAHGCRLVAVVSRARERAEEFAAAHGVPRAYEDLETALRDPAVEAVWVATPHGTHRDAVLAAARAGRHVLCEKPLATTVADGREMVLACRQAGVALATGFHLRHHPLHREARQIVQQGGAGAIVSVEAEWSLPARVRRTSAEWRRDPEMSGGGILMGTGIHAIDLLRFVLDDEVESVSACADSTPQQGAVDSRVVCLLRFRRGIFGSVRCLRGVHAPANDLLIEGDAALIRVRRGLADETRGALEVDGADTTLAGMPAGTNQYALQAEDFARAIAEHREPNASGLDGLRLIEVAAAIYTAAASGRLVRPEPSL